MDKPIGDYTLKEAKEICAQGNCRECRFYKNISTPKYTEADIALMKGMLAIGLKWVARDKNGSVFFFSEMPTKNCDAVKWVSTDFFNVPLTVMQSITWDDLKPTNIEDALKEVEG